MIIQVARYNEKWSEKDGKPRFKWENCIGEHGQFLCPSCNSVLFDEGRNDPLPDYCPGCKQPVRVLNER